MKETFFEALKIFSLTLVLVGFIGLAGWWLCGCATGSSERIDVDFWAGDSRNDGITRDQDHETIKCNTREMDNYICLSYPDLKNLLRSLESCHQIEVTYE